MSKRSRVVWSLLVGALVVATVGMVAAATWLSFLAFKSLAELVGWSQDTAWAVQPVVELFVLAGAAELAMRTWERRSRSLPEVLMYAALVVSIAVNVSSHVLANISAGRVWWHTVVIGVMAAMVPLAQLGGVYLLADRLRALGQVREEVADAGGSALEGSDPSVPDQLLLAAQAVAAHLGDRLSRRTLAAGLRERGHRIGTKQTTELLNRLRDAA